MTVDPARPIPDPDLILDAVMVWSTPVGDLAVDLSKPQRAQYRFQGRAVQADELRALHGAITAALLVASPRTRENTSP